MDNLRFFKEELDKTGNVVHGSFIDNFENILQYGICPPYMLPEEARPKKFFSGTSKDKAYCGTNANYISTFVIHDWNNYCLVDRKVWSPFFHYFIVTKHKDWGSDRKLSDEPWHMHSIELTLFNQKIAPDKFIGLVIPSDEDISELNETEKGQKIFRDDNRVMNSRYISDRLVELMRNRQSLKPIFDFNGNCVYHPETKSK